MNQLSIKEIHKILSILHDLQDDVQNNNRYIADKGICSYVTAKLQPVFANAEMNSYSVQRFLARIFKKWPQYSGDSYFPVPAPCSRKHPEYFYTNQQKRKLLWRGDYGELRKELLNYTAATIDCILKQQEKAS